VLTNHMCCFCPHVHRGPATEDANNTQGKSLQLTGATSPLMNICMRPQQHLLHNLQQAKVAASPAPLSLQLLSCESQHQAYTVIAMSLHSCTVMLQIVSAVHASHSLPACVPVDMC
jgi:hypothetical protein